MAISQEKDAQLTQSVLFEDARKDRDESKLQKVAAEDKLQQHLQQTTKLREEFSVLQERVVKLDGMREQSMKKRAKAQRDYHLLFDRYELLDSQHTILTGKHALVIDELAVALRAVKELTHTNSGRESELMRCHESLTDADTTLRDLRRKHALLQEESKELREYKEGLERLEIR